MMERLLTCIFTVLCLVSGSIVVAQRTPTISYMSQEQIKDIGETMELHCVIQYAQDNPVFWIKINRENPYNEVILSSGTALNIKDIRFAIKYDIASATYVLQIKDIQETDAAFYQCRIQLPVNNYISAEVELQVRKPRKPPITIIIISIAIIMSVFSIIIISYFKLKRKL